MSDRPVEVTGPETGFAEISSEVDLWTEIISGTLVIISQIAVCTSVYRPWAQLRRGRQRKAAQTSACIFT